MRKRYLLLSSVAALAILNLQAFADSTTLDDVDISTSEVQVISSSINVGQSSIETKQADHLSDLFRDIPGVDVGGSHSMNNKIIIRGVKDENLAITVDGAKQPNVDLFHHLSTLKINPDNLKKVNIEVGANSVIHGELGGAVEFETKDGKDFLDKDEQFGGMISATYDSNDSIGGALSLYGKPTDNSDFFAYYHYTDNNNWESGDGKEQEGRDGEVDDILLKYGIDINDEQRISLSYDKMTDEGDYLARPNFGADFNDGSIFPTEYIRDTYTLKHSMDKGENLLLNTTVYYNKMDLTREENGGNKRGDILEAEIVNKGVNSRAQSNYEIGNILNTFTYGLEFDKQSSHVEADGSLFGDDEEATTIALYVENAIDFDNGFIFTPGIRYTNYQLDGLVGDIKENKLTYSLAAEYAVNDNLSLLASHTTLFKGVPMQEVFANYRLNVVENPDIKSQTGDNNEIGFKYIQDNLLGADQIGFSAKYYITNLKNDIGYTYGDDWNMINLGNTKTKGIEASFAYSLNKFSGLLTYSKMDSNIEYSGEPLDTQIGDKFTLNLKYKANSQVGLSWKSVLFLDENDVNSDLYVDKKEGYAVHDIAVDYSPSNVKGLKVIAGIDNIFDKNYVSQSSIAGTLSGLDTTDYEPGRNFKVTLSYKF